MAHAASSKSMYTFSAGGVTMQRMTVKWDQTILCDWIVKEELNGRLWLTSQLSQFLKNVSARARFRLIEKQSLSSVALASLLLKETSGSSKWTRKKRELSWLQSKISTSQSLVLNSTTAMQSCRTITASYAVSMAAPKSSGCALTRPTILSHHSSQLPTLRTWRPWKMIQRNEWPATMP